VGTVLHAVMVAVTPTRCSQRVSGRINIRVSLWTLPICPCASCFGGSRSNNQSDNWEGSDMGGVIGRGIGEGEIGKE
jgi:hypothetical protein